MAVWAQAIYYWSPRFWPKWPTACKIGNNGICAGHWGVSARSGARGQADGRTWCQLTASLPGEPAEEGKTDPFERWGGGLRRSSSGFSLVSRVAALLKSTCEVLRVLEVVPAGERNLSDRKCSLLICWAVVWGWRVGYRPANIAGEGWDHQKSGHRKLTPCS